MNYTFQFGVAFAVLPELLQGALLTFQMGLVTFAGGSILGLLFAALKTYGNRRAKPPRDPREEPVPGSAKAVDRAGYHRTGLPERAHGLTIPQAI